MTQLSIHNIISIDDVLSSTMDGVSQTAAPNDPTGTGTISVQLGDAITGTVRTQNAEIWGPAGLISIPPNVQPNSGDAPQAISITRGDADIIIAQRNVQTQGLVGNLSAGDTVLYSPGSDGTGAAKVVLKGNGAITLFTTDDGTKEGNGVYLRLDSSKLSFCAPWGTMTFDASGFHIVTASGASLDLGGMSLGGLLPSSVASYANITAASVNVDGGIVCIGKPSPILGNAVISPTPSSEPLIPDAPIGVGIGAVLGIASTSVFIAPDGNIFTYL